MKKSLLALATTGFILANAGATLSFYDGFDYTSGQLLAPINDTSGTPNPGQLNVAYGYNWRYAGAGAVANNPPGIAGVGLSYTAVAAPGYGGLPPTTGLSVAYDTSKIGSARIQVTPAAVSSGTVYWSGLLRVDTIGTLTTGVNGMLLGGFNNSIGAGTLPTSVGAVLRIRTDTSDPTVYHIGTGMNSGTGAGVGGNNVQFANGINFLAGQTVFVVGAYEFVAGTVNDKAYMWINPSVADLGAALPPLPTLTSAPGSAIADSFTSLISFNLRNVNTVGAPAVLFDELRVGDSWADVTPVPEPAVASLLGLAVLMVVGRYRFRQR